MEKYSIVTERLVIEKYSTVIECLVSKSIPLSLNVLSLRIFLVDDHVVDHEFFVIDLVGTVLIP